MNVTVNLANKELQEGSSIEDLLVALSIKETRGVAIAINNAVIPKSTWAKHQLQENDSITIISATAGG